MREGVLPGSGEEAEAWGQQTRLRPSPALFLPPRSLGAAWARGEREAAEVPAVGRPALAHPAPAPADSCSWARAVRSRLRGLRPLGLPPLRLYPSCSGADHFATARLSPRARLFFHFPVPLLEYFAPAFEERGWKGGGWNDRRRRRKRGPEEEEKEEDRRTVGRRPHATLSGHLPSRPAPAHTPSPASYFRTRKVRAALGDSAAGLVLGKPRVCSRLVRRAPSQGYSPDPGWLRLQPVPGSRTSISFSRSSESKRLCRAPSRPLSSRGRVALPPTHRPPAWGEGIWETGGEGGGPLVCQLGGRCCVSKTRGQRRGKTFHPGCGPFR